MNDVQATLSAPKTVRIGERLVGPGQPVFVVAEAGVNHNGDESTAMKMIDGAVAAGVDAIKFQLFDAESLTTADAPTVTYQSQSTGSKTQRAMLRELELSPDAFGRLAKACGERGIEFILTPFTSAAVHRAASLGVSAIKVASTDLIDFKLLTNAAETQLPVIISTGAAHEHEIADAVDLLVGCGAGEWTIALHCISAYPAKVQQANLGAIGRMARQFGCVTGFSDHTESTFVSAMAVCAGAHVLEKHFTLDRTADGPDHAMSLEVDGLAEYVRHARMAREAMGSGDFGMLPVEMEVREGSRKRIVAAQAISAGQTLTLDMLTVKRASSGLEANHLMSLVGRRVLQDVSCDQPLHLGSVL